MLFLVAVSAALGATSLAYAVLDSGRITTIGVLVTFALLCSSPRSSRESPPRRARAGSRPAPRLLVDTLVDGALIVASFYTAYVIVVGGKRLAVAAPHLHLDATRCAPHAGTSPCGRSASIAATARTRSAVRWRGIAAAVVLSEVVAYLFVANTQTLLDFPAKIFVLDAVICFVFLVAGRFAERAGAEGCPHLAQARQHRDRVVTDGRTGGSADGARATACSAVVAVCCSRSSSSRACTSGRRRSIRHRGCSRTRSSTRRSRGRSPRPASRRGAGSSTGVPASFRG